MIEVYIKYEEWHIDVMNNRIKSILNGTYRTPVEMVRSGDLVCPTYKAATVPCNCARYV